MMKTIYKMSVVRKTILNGLLFFVTFTAYTQQQSQFTQFRDAGMLFNPSMAGSGERLKASFIGRWQWVGFEGSPKTNMALLEGTIPGKNIGLGLILSHDEVAISKTTSVRLNYAYKLQTSKGMLSMGIAGSFINHRINFADLYIVDPDNTFSENSSAVKPNFGMGINFKSDRLSIGVSVPEIINNKLEQNGVELFSQTRHLYLSGGYTFPINESIDLQANTLVRMVAGSPLAADMNVMAWHNSHKIGFGLGHRLDESVSAIVQVKATDKVLFGYSFDYVTNNQLSNLAKTSHEVLLTYSVPWSGFKNNKDVDNDGVKDKEDECPNQAGPISNNGCPFPDTDGDGIPDVNDKCPQIAGRVDSFGCPDTDNDCIIDIEDNCPENAGSKANGGCPDSDQDGVLDHLDQCPNIAGISMFEGCPDTDNDGVKDSEDRCPDVSGLKENNGCPGISEETKRVLALALEGVQFESSKDILKTSSYAVLENIVKVMKDNPNYRLKVSGYTDSSGRDDINLKLSKQRANGVKEYLVKKGITTNRINADGFGEINPVADNETKEGRAKNRRVEFEIVL